MNVEIPLTYEEIIFIWDILPPDEALNLTDIDFKLSLEMKFQEALKNLEKARNL